MSDYQNHETDVLTHNKEAMAYMQNCQYPNAFQSLLLACQILKQPDAIAKEQYKSMLSTTYNNLALYYQKYRHN